MGLRSVSVKVVNRYEKSLIVVESENAGTEDNGHILGLEVARQMVFEVGDVVKLKKKHPCGSFNWEILRVGADFRLKCEGCGHQIMVSRKLVEKNCREHIKKEEKL